MEVVEEDLIDQTVECEVIQARALHYSRLFRFTYLIYPITFSFVMCFLMRFYFYLSDYYTRSINFILPLFVFISISYYLLLFSIKKEQNDILSSGHKLILGGLLTIFTAVLHNVYLLVFQLMEISDIISHSAFLSAVMFPCSALALFIFEFIRKIRSLL